MHAKASRFRVPRWQVGSARRRMHEYEGRLHDILCSGHSVYRPLGKLHFRNQSGIDRGKITVDKPEQTTIVIGRTSSISTA
jgi:hypothetical protein